MPNQFTLEQNKLEEQTQAVDDGRVAADPFTLPAISRTLLDARLVIHGRHRAPTVREREVSA